MRSVGGEVTVDEVERMAGRWWVYLLIGIGWIVFGFLILTFELTTVWGVAVFVGIGLIAGGVAELSAARVVPRSRWAHTVFGVASIVAGVVALVWPGATFLVLAAIVAWYLMVNGVVDIALGFLARRVDDLWWLAVLVGAAQLVVGLWAVGYAERSIALLVVWVAAAAIGRGLSGLLLGFALREAGELRHLDVAVG
jgi:uncharacterized membrane protein HdeD (DUF308 family)